MSEVLLNKLIQLYSKGNFSIQDIENIRMKILKKMKENKFTYYWKTIETIVNKLNNVISNDVDLQNDDYWIDEFGTDVWWEKENPNINQKYFSRIGITSVTTTFLNDKYVNKLIGEASWMTIQQVILFKTLISNYFKHDSDLFLIHLNMDYTYMKKINELKKTNVKQNLKKQVENIIKSLLSGSGPFILKILQQINTSNTSKIKGIDVSELAKDIFTDTPSLTKEERLFIENNLELKGLKKIEDKTLGSASLGESHEALMEIRDGDEIQTIKTVIKFLKPIYAYFFICEIYFLLKVCWKNIRSYTKQLLLQKGIDPQQENKFVKQCRQLLLFLIKEFSKEFNFQQEYENTVRGYQIYNGKNKYIKSVVAIDYALDPFPILALQHVPGKSLNTLLNEGTLSKKELENIYKLVDDLSVFWLQNILWSSDKNTGGFFHADLHPGNVMYSDGTLYVIDFGSFGVLSKQQQCSLITSMIISGQFYHLKNKEEDLPKHEKNIKTMKNFIKSIWNVCQVKNYDEKLLEDLSILILEKNYKKYNHIYFGEIFLDVVQYSEDVGDCVKGSVLMFGRGIAYINTLISAISSKCQDELKCPKYWKIDKIISRNLMIHPSNIINFLAHGSVCK